MARRWELRKGSLGSLCRGSSVSADVPTAPLGAGISRAAPRRRASARPPAREKPPLSWPRSAPSPARPPVLAGSCFLPQRGSAALARRTHRLWILKMPSGDLLWVALTPRAWGGVAGLASPVGSGTRVMEKVLRECPFSPHSNRCGDNRRAAGNSFLFSLHYLCFFFLEKKWLRSKHQQQRFQRFKKRAFCFF